MTAYHRRVPEWNSSPLIAELADAIGGSELQSILLEVMRRRATRRASADVLAQYRRDRFTGPAATDQRESIAIDGHLLAAADGFEAIELSPVAPLGVCSTIAPTDQHRVLSALRGTEVVSDPTNVLALECATRIRAGGAAPLLTAAALCSLGPGATQSPRNDHFR